MVAAIRTVTVKPNSEVDRLLDEAGDRPLVLIKNGVRYRLAREELRDSVSEADYDPERLMEEARSIAGIITPDEAEEWIANIYRWREEGSRPPDQT